MVSLGGFSRIALSVAGLLTALLFLVIAAAASAADAHLLSNLIQAGILLWATVCAFVAARRSATHFRRLWRMLGAALVLASAGQAAVCYYGSIHPVPRTSPWPADILLFTWVAPAAMMLLPWREEESRSARWERILDFAQITIVFVTAYFYFFYVASLWETHGILMFRRMLEAAVARDALMGAGFFFRGRTVPHSSARPFFAKIASFFLALGVAEGAGIFWFANAAKLTNWADAAWALPFAYLSIVGATWSAPAETQRAPEASNESPWITSQFLPVAIPLLVIFMGRQIAREQITISALAVAASFVCSAARLLLSSQRQRSIAEDLRRAEHAARQSEQMFSAAFRSSPDAISIARVPEGVILEVNDSYTKLTGFTREEALGETPEGLGMWVDGEIMADMQTRFRQQGELRDEELRFRRKDGEIRYGRLSGAVISLDEQRYSLIIVRDITERKRAEDALRTSEVRFRTLLDTQRVGIIAWGTDGRCRFVNPAMLEMLGAGKMDAIGVPIQEIAAGVPAFDAEGKELPWQVLPSVRALETRQPVRNQVIGRLHPVTNQMIWSLIDSVPEFSPDGEFAGVIASATDITDLQRAEEEKRISQEMFTKAFRSSPDSMTISTLSEGRIVEVNDSFTRLFGWQRDECVGRMAADLGIWSRPADRDELRRALLGQGRTTQFETVLRTKSGECHTVQISADVITLNGETCMLSLAHDMTARKLREEALYASEERFRTLVQNIDAAIVLFSSEGRIQFANQAAERIFGITEEEARGKLSNEVPLVLLDARENEIPFASRPVPRVLATGRPVHNAVLGWRRVGSSEVSWLVGNAVPQYSKDGKLNGVIVSLVDITEQKKSEEKLRRLSSRLLQLQDEERRRLGRDLHDSLAQLVLAVNLRLAQVTRSSPKLENAGRQLLSEARETLQEMSRQIRTLSYLLHPPLLDELGLASAIREYAKGFSDRSGIRLNVEIQEDFQRLSQEAETALFRIVQESLTNIQKHSGSPTASLRLAGEPSAVNLEVRDSGRGMPAVPDRKAEQSGARFGVGILGMRERLTQLGGELQIESNGSGTTVRARIPLPVEEPHAVSNPRGG